MGYNTTPWYCAPACAPTGSGRTLLVSRNHRRRRRIRPGGPCQRHARTRLRSRETGSRAFLRQRPRHIRATNLPFQDLEFSADGKEVTVQAGGRFKCAVDGAGCAAVAGGAAGRARWTRRRTRWTRRWWCGRGSPEVLSPRQEARRLHPREQSLGPRRRHQSREPAHHRRCQGFRVRHRQRGLGQQQPPRPAWSPDSKRIATFQQDQRGVGEMYLVDTTVGHPTLKAWKYPLPGDSVVTTIQRVTIDLDSAARGAPEDGARPAPLHALR